jgi:hypothetical protein
LFLVSLLFTFKNVSYCFLKAFTSWLNILTVYCLSMATAVALCLVTSRKKCYFRDDNILHVHQKVRRSWEKSTLYVGKILSYVGIFQPEKSALVLVLRQALQGAEFFDNPCSSVIQDRLPGIQAFRSFRSVLRFFSHSFRQKC